MKYSDIYVDYTYGRENKSGWEGARTVLKITYKSTYRDEGADRIITVQPTMLTYEVVTGPNKGKVKTCLLMTFAKWAKRKLAKRKLARFEYEKMSFLDAHRRGHANTHWSH